MAAVLFLCVCLMVSVYGQPTAQRTSTTTTQIFVDPSETNHLSEAFHKSTVTAEQSLVNQNGLSEIERTLQGLHSANLPNTLKQILGGGTPVNTAVREATHNSEILLNQDGSKIEKAFQLMQNNIALEQILKEQTSQGQAAQQMQQQVILQLLQQQQQQQEQQQRQLQLQQQQRQQQLRQQQENSILGGSVIPDPSSQLTNQGQSLISANLVQTPGSTPVSFGSLGNPFSSASTSSSSTSSTSTSNTNRVVENKDKSSNKKKELEARLQKLKAKIAAKKKARAEKKAAKAAAKAKAAAETDAQRQTEELSFKNQFNTIPSGVFSTDGVSSQDVLTQATENAQAEAALHRQATGGTTSQFIPPSQQDPLTLGQVNAFAAGMPLGAQSFNNQQLNPFTRGMPTGAQPFNNQQANAFATGIRTGAQPFNSQQVNAFATAIPTGAQPFNNQQANVFTTGISTGAQPFNNQNNLFQSGATNSIGTLDISPDSVVPTQIQQRAPVASALQNRATSTFSPGFLATVNAAGEVVPDSVNPRYTSRRFQSPRNFVRFPSASQMSYSSRFASNMLPTYARTQYSSPYVFNAPYTATRSLMSPYSTPIIMNAPYTPFVFMNTPHSSPFSSRRRQQMPYVIPV